MTNLTLTREDRAAGLVVLHETREYVERSWTQGTLARDVYGEPVPPNSPRAVCWCLFGGLCAAIGVMGGDDLSDEGWTRPGWVAEFALDQAAETVAIGDFNDRAMSVREVLDVIELAAAWLKGDER